MMHAASAAGASSAVAFPPRRPPRRGASPLDEPFKPAKLHKLLVALAYTTLSVLLLFFNKALLSSFDFPCANVITLAQLCFSNALLYGLRRGRYVAFVDDVSLVPRDCVDKRTGFPTIKMFRRVAPLSCAYFAYVALSMSSVRGVNLPMYTTLRRTTAAFTMTAEYFAVGKRQSRAVTTAVGAMVAGAFVAALGDAHFDASGYARVFANNAATAVYLACISRYGKSSGLNSFGMMWCNGVVTAPAVLASTMATGELAAVGTFRRLGEFSFEAVVVASCALAFALNYAVFLNTSLNSALTQTICGNLKDVVVIVLGFNAFGGVAVNAVNACGVAVGLCASFRYATLKFKVR